MSDTNRDWATNLPFTTLSLICSLADLEAASPAERADWLARLEARWAAHEEARMQREHQADHDDAVAADEWFLPVGGTRP